jgi:hypothetical protein
MIYLFGIPFLIMVLWPLWACRKEIIKYLTEQD